MMLRRYGDELVNLIAQGRDAKLPRPPREVRIVEPRVMERYNALREWRKQRASERGVDSDVIVSKNVLWVLAENAPRSLDALEGIPGLGPWRLHHYGMELLEVLQKTG
jgi:superfamily II DNA helicase RecQ